MLHVRSLRAGYGADEVLHGCDFDARAGEIVALFGRNGAGKTTLLRALIGATPSAGQIELHGESMGSRAPEERFARGMTYVPQGHRVFRSLSVGDNVLIGACERGPRPWRIDELRERIPLLAARWTQPAGTLSGGETQLVLLARALAGNGILLLADEPAEGLDMQAIRVLTGLLREAALRGAALIVAEQRSAYLRDIAGQTLTLSDGRLSDLSDG
ncbi:MAG: ABC transporter ATP-binding protein [Candidatus Velthaea sp.]